MSTASGATIDDLSDASPQSLAQWYAAPDDWVRCNMVLSLDGSFTDRAGRSAGLSSPEDLRVLRVLRAVSDVIVVGGFTARSEPYVPGRLHPSVEHLRTRPPRLAVVTRSCDFDPGSPLFSGAQPPIILTSTHGSSGAPAGLRAVADIVGVGEDVSSAGIIAALRQRGLTRILVEGGPAIAGPLRASGCLDEIAVTVAPVVVGHGDSRPPLGPGFSELRVAATGRIGDQVVNRLFTRAIALGHGHSQVR